MRKKGKIVRWNEDKGFGFIQPFDSKQQIFIHITEIQHRRTPSPGDVITYSNSSDENNRPSAVDAVMAGDKHIKKKARELNKSVIIFAVGYLVLYAVLVLFKMTPVELWGFMCLLSVITYIAFARDKAKAQKNHWRVQESTLLLFSLMGGWPGALIAQQRLRHKSSKQSFKFVLWVTIFVSVLIYAWAVSPKGQPYVEELVLQVKVWIFSF